MHYTVQDRQYVERAIIKAAVTSLIAAGFSLRVHDGEAWGSPTTNDPEIILKAIMATDEDRIFVGKDYATLNLKIRDGMSDGWLYLVYGNDGTDVISDYTMNLEPYLKTASDLAEQIDKHGLSSLLPKA